MVCIDSDILIDFLRNNKEATARIDELCKRGEELATTSINSFELLKGIPQQSRLNIETVKSFIATLKIYNFTLSASEKAAFIFNDLKSKGEMIELPDVMIAAIAIENGTPVLTRNKRHFSKIQGLQFAEI